MAISIRAQGQLLSHYNNNEPAREKENEDIVFELTEYGEKVWKTVKIGYSELTEASDLKFEK